MKCKLHEATRIIFVSAMIEAEAFQRKQHNSAQVGAFSAIQRKSAPFGAISACRRIQRNRCTQRIASAIGAVGAFPAISAFGTRSAWP